MSKLQVSKLQMSKLQAKLLHFAIGSILTLAQGCQVCTHREETIVKHMVELTSKIKVEDEFRNNSMELGFNYKKEF